jgi:hypothetical protein
MILARASAVTTPPQSKIMKGFSLYENAIHRFTIQYPTTWRKQEILLNNDHTDLHVMFVVPIGTLFSDTEDLETTYDKISYAIYNQFFPEVVLSLKRLPVHENYTLEDISNDHIHSLGICFDNVNIVDTLYDYSLRKIPSSELLYTYTDPLQNHLHKKGMKIIGLKEHKEISITYSSQTEDFDRFLQTVRRMIDTMSVWDSPDFYS